MGTKVADGPSGACCARCERAVCVALILTFCTTFTPRVFAQTEQEWIQQCSGLVKAGKYPEALVKVKLALKEFPNSNSLLYGRAPQLKFTRITHPY